jgi:hypothetical protein
LFIEKAGYRKSKTYDSGKSGLSRAIKASETVAKKLVSGNFSNPTERKKEDKPKFIAYANKWVVENQARWDPNTQDRYQAIIRLHLTSCSCFSKPIDQVDRKDIKLYLKRLLKIRSPRTAQWRLFIL